LKYFPYDRVVCVTGSTPTFVERRSRNDTSILTAKKIAAWLSVTFSLPLLCFPCDRTRCFPSRLAARTIARNSRARATAATADVLAGRRPRDGYDIAGNRYAISRAIHARVMPNTNGIWIYPERNYADGELYTSAGFGKASRTSHCMPVA